MEKNSHEGNEDVDQKYLRPDTFMGIRHLQMLLLFLLLTIGYGMRVNLSVGINAMTDSTASSNPDVPVYNWTNKSVILSSFFWGYIILQVLAGQLAKSSYGPKWFLVLAMFVNSLACALIPLMADKLGSGGVMGCRVLQGLFQGFFFPSIHSLLGKWAPPPERSRLTTFVYSGSSFGVILSMPITGLIAASWLGWPWSFYLFGLLGMVWIVLWLTLGANNPRDHKWISEKEKDYIIHSFGPNTNKCNGPTPWKAIFTSMPVWSIIVANFGQNWGYSLLLTELPSYLSGVMHFNMTDNGILSAAPYLALMILCYVFGPLSDAMINRKMFSRGTVRKIFNTVGVCVPAIALLVLSYVPDDQGALCVTVLIIAVGTNAAVFPGFTVNHIDISPNHAGTLMGIANGSSNIFSIISPLVVQAVVGNDLGDKSKWRIIFIISSVAYIVSDIFYVIYASGEIQPWNNLPQEEKVISPTKPEVIAVPGTSDKNKKQDTPKSTSHWNKESIK